ncbi:dihydrofolate reductase family protein [Paenibacillus sp. NPDC057934]|uniref:dihydrofolate reductase family protein n=1 Tax=Paenibacillus sp. NPDC057934 TaxID=3346282 RepID=UPI0036DCBAD2
MKRPVVLYIAASLDGYIARGDGGVDWLNDVEGEGDNGYSDFYNTIDTVLIGKKTYDQTFELTDEFPYADKQCYVFSRSEQPPSPYVTFIHEDMAGFVHKLKEQDGGKIWIVGGAEVLDVLMKEKLVDEFIVTITPIVLGNGIPLFKGDNPEQKLTLKGSKSLGQFVELHYVVK